MKKVLVNEVRAREVFSLILDLWKRRAPPYDGIIPVSGEFILPKNMEVGSRDHALFLFSACSYMRGKINSNTALMGLGKVYADFPWMFRSEEFLNLNGSTVDCERLLGYLLTEKGLGFNAEEVARHWIANHAKLAFHWDSNPVNLYSGISGYDDICGILIKKGDFKEDTATGFYGFRHKMASMLTYFLGEAGFIEPMLFPVPVDFHILRVLVASEVLSVSHVGSGTRLNVAHLSKAARNLTFEYCEESGESPIDLADALWHLSRTLCRNYPGNKSRAGKYDARRTPIEDLSPTGWTKGEERRYHLSCGVCPLNDVCKWSIPSANYYIQGVLEVREQRKKPLDLFV